MCGSNGHLRFDRTRVCRVGNYFYDQTGNAGPHAVTRVVSYSGTRNYSYDANGNLTQVSGGGAPNRSIAYDLNQKPASLIRGNATTDFKYSPDGNRWRQIANDPDNNRHLTTYYLGKAFEYVVKIENGSTVYENRHYVGDYLVYTTRSGASTATTERYLHGDHLGSVDTITTGSGGNYELKGFDAFGKPRAAWQDAILPGVVLSDTTHRGFTAHEHLDSQGLIHMNGRAYDPYLGRFLSVDPFIQFPENSQSLNPYSYILNNPLSGTDPTGYTIAPLGPERPLGKSGYGGTITIGNHYISINGSLNTIGTRPIENPESLDAGDDEGGDDEDDGGGGSTLSKDDLGDHVGGQRSTSGGTASENRTGHNRRGVKTEAVEKTLSVSPRNAAGGYDSVEEAVLAQYLSYDNEYRTTIENNSELLGATFERKGNHYFTTMVEVPRKFEAILSLDGIKSSEVRAITHTHPDSESFNGIDFRQPASSGLPFFVRSSNGKVDRWNSKGAARYVNRVHGLRRSGSKRALEEQIKNPSKWGIENVCEDINSC